ncbi:toll/interleukin-1 receptor domain-containing protein [Saccharothrix lopnurensis]|uniref:Toll/interleukin-1 receptor domain-containing protein n=1 Tax=Saccharothrix lopnurensis TaxID=1670621 RepID=A0ABW1PIA8_9PSEU
MVMVDVEGFGDARRTLPHQLRTREGMYGVLTGALETAGITWEACHHEDRGDSVFVLVPPEYPKAPLLEVLPDALVRALRAYNQTTHEAGRTRLRLAVHAGEVAFDEHGATSTALTTAFRLLDAIPVKRALTGSPGLLAMIVSRLIFDEVVRQSAVLDPSTFRPVSVEVKEVRDTAWIALPDAPYLPNHEALAPINQHGDSNKVTLAGQFTGAGHADTWRDSADVSVVKPNEMDSVHNMQRKGSPAVDGVHGLTEAATTRNGYLFRDTGAQVPPTTNSTAKRVVDNALATGRRTEKAEIATVFISYLQADAPAAERLATNLRRRGHKVWLDSREINLGDSIIEKVDKGLAISAYLVLCYSADDSTSLRMKREWMSALARQLDGAGIRILPVRLTGGTPPAILADVKYADLTIDWAGGVDALCMAMR